MKTIHLIIFNTFFCSQLFATTFENGPKLDSSCDEKLVSDLSKRENCLLHADPKSCQYLSLQAVITPAIASGKIDRVRARELLGPIESNYVIEKFEAFNDYLQKAKQAIDQMHFETGEIQKNLVKQGFVPGSDDFELERMNQLVKKAQQSTGHIRDYYSWYNTDPTEPLPLPDELYIRTMTSELKTSGELEPEFEEFLKKRTAINREISTLKVDEKMANARYTNAARKQTKIFMSREKRIAPYPEDVAAYQKIYELKVAWGRSKVLLEQAQAKYKSFDDAFKSFLEKLSPSKQKLITFQNEVLQEFSSKALDHFDQKLTDNKILKAQTKARFGLANDKIDELNQRQKNIEKYKAKFSRMAASRSAAVDIALAVSPFLQSFDVKECSKELGLNKLEQDYLHTGSFLYQARASKVDGLFDTCNNFLLNDPVKAFYELNAKFGGVPSGICKLMKKSANQFKSQAESLLQQTEVTCNLALGINYKLEKKDNKYHFVFSNSDHTEIRLPIQQLSLHTLSEINQLKLKGSVPQDELNMMAKKTAPYPRFNEIEILNKKTVNGNTVWQKDQNAIQLFLSDYQKIHPANITETRPDLADLSINCELVLKDTSKYKSSVSTFCKMKNAILQARSLISENRLEDACSNDSKVENKSFIKLHSK